MKMVHLQENAQRIASFATAMQDSMEGPSLWALPAVGPFILHGPTADLLPAAGQKCASSM